MTHTHTIVAPKLWKDTPRAHSPGNQLWSTLCIPAKSQVREGLFAAGRCLVNELTWWPFLHDQIWSFNKRKTPMITCGILVVKNGTWFYCPTAAQCKEWNCSGKIAGNGRCDWPRFRWAEELAWTNWTLPDLDAAFPKFINSNQKLQSSRAWVTCFCFNWSNPVCFRGSFLSTLEFCSEWLLDPRIPMSGERMEDADSNLAKFLGTTARRQTQSTQSARSPWKSQDCWLV